MAILTDKELLAACREMAGTASGLEQEKSGVYSYRDRWGYVLGGQGELYTRELAEKWGAARRCGKSRRYFEKDCARWFGRRVVDCSGMIVEAFRMRKEDFGDRSADSFFHSFTTERGDIAALPEEPGVIVWKKGHIGVYAGDGRVIEARGYRYGVVESELSAQRWTDWGRLKEVDYKEQPVPARMEFRRELRYKRNMMRGQDVRDLQTLLARAGQSPGAADGVFGRRTRDAVKSFQRAAGLPADGVAAQASVTALGGAWLGERWTLARALKKKSPRMRGGDVKNAQKELICRGRGCGKSGADGIFGEDTEKAVRRFQREGGLKEDGVIGRDTAEALGGRWE